MLQKLKRLAAKLYSRPVGRAPACSHHAFCDSLIARYARGSAALQRPGGYMTRDEKEALRRRVLKHTL